MRREKTPERPVDLGLDFDAIDVRGSLEASRRRPGKLASIIAGFIIIIISPFAIVLTRRARRGNQEREK